MNLECCWDLVRPKPVPEQSDEEDLDELGTAGRVGEELEALDWLECSAECATEIDEQYQACVASFNAWVNRVGLPSTFAPPSQIINLLSMSDAHGLARLVCWASWFRDVEWYREVALRYLREHDESITARGWVYTKSLWDLADGARGSLNNIRHLLFQLRQIRGDQVLDPRWLVEEVATCNSRSGTLPAVLAALWLLTDRTELEAFRDDLASRGTDVRNG